MSVITEAALRVILKDADLSTMKEYRVEAGVIVTPAAKAWLVDNKIDLIVGDKRIIRNPTISNDPPRPSGDTPAAPAAAADPDEKPSALPKFEKPARYESLYGGFYYEKPEHMTALYGNILAFKDHKVFRLRGLLDSLDGKIVETQLAFQRLGLKKGVAELAEVHSWVKEILRCEVLGEPLQPVELFGMDEAELRKRSHTPKKYYGIRHFSASLEDGEAVILLNRLRTEVREVELAAYEAFKKENGEPERPDLIRALNRLSSVFYVMMFKAKSKEYES